jgi:hypothetical protein
MDFADFRHPSALGHLHTGLLQWQLHIALQADCILLIAAEDTESEVTVAEFETVWQAMMPEASSRPSTSTEAAGAVHAVSQHAAKHLMPPPSLHVPQCACLFFLNCGVKLSHTCVLQQVAAAMGGRI